jgi:hypothetical protein
VDPGAAVDVVVAGFPVVVDCFDVVAEGFPVVVDDDLPIGVVGGLPEVVVNGLPLAAVEEFPLAVGFVLVTSARFDWPPDPPVTTDLAGFPRLALFTARVFASFFATGDFDFRAVPCVPRE